MVIWKKIITAYRVYKTQGLNAVIIRCYEVFDRRVMRIKKFSFCKKENPLRQHLNTVYCYVSQKETDQLSYVPKALDSLEGEIMPIKLMAFYSFKSGCENYWIDVSRAQPQYLGHHQPRIPGGELGFYDLRVSSVLHQQIQLAKQYGVQGFCFDYEYGDKNNTEKSQISLFLNEKSMIIDFCLCWNNESEDVLDFFSEILPIIEDGRYLRVNDKPILLITNIAVGSSIDQKIEQLRHCAKNNGLLGLHIVAVESFAAEYDFCQYGFDAVVVLPLPYANLTEKNQSQVVLNKNYKGKVYHYDDLITHDRIRNTDDYVQYQTVIPSWDNEAEQAGEGVSLCGATPEKYAKWLTATCNETLNNPIKDEHLLFIYAWNEWSKAAYLEPDRKNGYAYLHATANVLRNLSNDKHFDNAGAINSHFRKCSSIAVILHVYYEDVGLEILQMILSSHAHDVDIIVTIREDCSEVFLKMAQSLSSSIYFIFVKNKGRDILPFIYAYQFVSKNNYEYICKLHTKKSPQRKDGELWRKKLIESLWGNADEILRLFKVHTNLGLIAPKGSFANVFDEIVGASSLFNEGNMGNKYWLDIILVRLECKNLMNNYEIIFPAGSMFWAKVDALKRLDLLILPSEFELESGQQDGTLAHAVERIIGVLVEKNGYVQREVSAIDL